MPKTTITQIDRAALEGIFVLHKRYSDLRDELERAAAEIVGEEINRFGYPETVSDELSGAQNPTVENLLANLEITVEA